MSGLRIAVMASGNGSNLQAIIDAEKRGALGGSVELVISSSIDAYALLRAEKSDIDSLYVRSMARDGGAVLEELKKKKIDLVVLAGYMGILGKDFVEEYRGRIINIHPSLIPSFSGMGYYGQKVHKAVIERGVKLTGATVHFVDEGADTGPIIIQKPVPVEYGDTVDGLGEKVLEVEHDIIVEAVSLYCRGKIKLSKGRVKILS